MNDEIQIKTLNKEEAQAHVKKQLGSIMDAFMESRAFKSLDHTTQAVANGTNSIAMAKNKVIDRLYDKYFAESIQSIFTNRPSFSPEGLNIVTQNIIKHHIDNISSIYKQSNHNKNEFFRIVESQYGKIADDVKPIFNAIATTVEKRAKIVDCLQKEKEKLPDEFKLFEKQASSILKPLNLNLDNYSFVEPLLWRGINIYREPDKKEAINKVYALKEPISAKESAINNFIKVSSAKSYLSNDLFETLGMKRPSFFLYTETDSKTYHNLPAHCKPTASQKL
jgi:hypothetical protein